jgi:hypothetical protein
MSKRFREMLLEIHGKPMPEQLDHIQLALDDWITESEQTDDILLIGFKPL